jgi:Mn2+/Fe2+ NRAMP family transporter
VEDKHLPEGDGAVAVAEKPPVDPGCLPAWKVDDMPTPTPLGFRHILALIGPGLVMIGGTIGTGEWVSGAGVAALYHGALLWVAPLAILAQVMLNSESMRYTLVTGEPVFTGFMRCKPGPRVWLLAYLFLDCVGWMPALAGLAAQILIYTFNGQQTPDRDVVRIVSVSILVLCAVLLCFGGKIYNTLEVVLSGKVIFVLGYMLFVTVVFVPFSVWKQVAGGMVNPFWIPENVQWNLIGAVAGLAGIGGLGNILASNYVREKGWGMGAKSGAIPSAVGGTEIQLSHLGTIARPTPENVGRFRRWWSYVTFDQFGLWSWGSLVGMLLPCVLGAAYIKDNYFQQKGAELKAAAALAQDFGAVHGQTFTILTLLCGFIIMFPGQFSSMDGVARRWCDAFWSGSRRARAAQPHQVKYLYYAFIAVYVVIGIIINGFGVSPAYMMVFNANLANLSITACLLHTLYVNTHFLPKEFQPTMAKRAGMLLAAAFYAGIFAMVTQQTIQKAMAGTLFPK